MLTLDEFVHLYRLHGGIRVLLETNEVPLVPLRDGPRIGSRGGTTIYSGYGGRQVRHPT